MLAIERRQQIVEILRRDRRVVVGELSSQFAVTEETIRRDLKKLKAEGLISRTHGGAIAVEPEPEDRPYFVRQTINIAAKRQIAARAATLVKSGNALMIDSSSTAYEVLRFLEDLNDLTIITNSVRILANPNVTKHTIISVGGELRRHSMTFVGPIANQALTQFNADVALVSCKAMSVNGGGMDASAADAEVKRAFIGNAQHVCLLVDGDKFDGTALIRVSSFEPIDVVITDRAPNQAWADFLAREHVELMY
jgi:DeoR/GlpR family transcriptional regulator of sugar metabolism